MSIMQYFVVQSQVSIDIMQIQIMADEIQVIENMRKNRIIANYCSTFIHVRTYTCTESQG